VAVWLSGNALALINLVALRRVRLVLGWVTVQSDHPSVGRRNEYWRWSWPPL